MTRISPSDRTRKLLIGLAVAVLHVLAVLFLVRAFAPGVLPDVVEDTLRIVAFEVPTDPPAPPPSEPVPDEGASGNVGEQAVPRAAAAPPAKIAPRPTNAPPASSTGTANRSGNAVAGAGTGGGGEGAGAGSGRGGDGRGGYFITPPVKIAGDITSARDYPRETRDLRNGQSVIISLRVGTDGRPTSCQVTQPSPDAEADRITCRLAIERFRFKPAMDPDGKPVVSGFRWRQRWFE